MNTKTTELIIKIITVVLICLGLFQTAVWAGLDPNKIINQATFVP